MDKVMDIRNFVAAAEGDAEHVLGKFLYFSLANLLVDTKVCCSVSWTDWMTSSPC